jgi:VanZ family protein
MLLTLPLVASAILSLTIEVLQCFTTRNPSLLDVFFNSVGAGIGVIIVSVLKAYIPPLSWPAKTPDRAALVLLGMWVAYMFFPFVPLMSRTQAASKLKVFLNSPLLDPVPFTSSAAVWFIGGGLLAAVHATRPKLLLCLLALATIPAQVLVMSRQPVAADLAGAAAGCIAFLLTGTMQLLFCAAAVAAMIVRGLAPFHFQSSTNPVEWIPFTSVLEANWQHGLFVLIAKGFYVSLALWSFSKFGFRFSVFVVACLVGALEWAQLHLPGRTPAVTDIAIVLIAGFALRKALPSNPAERRQPLQTRSGAFTTDS